MSKFKRALSICLVMVLALGMFIVPPASAVTYTDESQIKNIDAVTLLGEFEILNGFNDGTFRPLDTLTRAQVAKMVYVAFNGGKDDLAANYKGQSHKRFSDVMIGHWAEGYINWAAENNIVSGRGADANGNVRYSPDDTMTGVEVLKLMLGALSYNPNTERFQNDSNWSNNVIRVAENVGILKGFTANPALPITRDGASLLMANMIYSYVVQYEGGVAVSTGDTFMSKYLGLVKLQGILTANQYVSLDGDGLGSVKATISGIKSFTDSNKTFEVTLNVDAPTELIGQHVTVSVRLNPGYTTANLSSGNSMQAIRDIQGKVEATANMNTVVTASTDDFTVKSGYKLSAIDVEDDINGFYINSYKLTEDDYTSNQLKKDNVEDLIEAQIKALPRGNEVKLISNDGDKQFDIVLVTNWAFVEVKGITSKGKVSFSAPFDKVMDEADITVIDDEELEKGDFYLAYQVGNRDADNSKKGTAVLRRVEPKTGELEDYISGIGGTSPTISVKDVDFTYCSIPGVGNIGSLTGFRDYFRTAVGQEVKYYAYNGFMLKCGLDDGGESQYLYAWYSGDTGEKLKTFYVEAVLDTGELIKYTVDSVDNEAADEDNIHDSRIYRYIKNSSGNVDLYTVSYWDSDIKFASGTLHNSPGTTIYEEGDSDFESYELDDDTIFVIQDTNGGSWISITGVDNFPTIKNTKNTEYAVAYDSDDDDMAKIIYIFDANFESIDAKQYLIVSSIKVNANSQTFVAFDGKKEFVELTTTKKLNIEPFEVYTFTFSGEKVSNASSSLVARGRSGNGNDPFGLYDEDFPDYVARGFVTDIDTKNDEITLSILNEDDDGDEFVQSITMPLVENPAYFIVDYSTDKNVDPDDLDFTATSKTVNIINSDATKIKWYNNNDIYVGDFEAILVRNSANDAIETVIVLNCID